VCAQLEQGSEAETREGRIDSTLHVKVDVFVNDIGVVGAAVKIRSVACFLRCKCIVSHVCVCVGGEALLKPQDPRLCQFVS